MTTTSTAASSPVKSVASSVILSKANPIPANALTFEGEVLTYEGEVFTYGN